MRNARGLAWYAVLVASTAVVVLPGRASPDPPCDEHGADAAAVARARSAVQASCGCSGAARLAEWEGCVHDALDPLVAAAELPATCARRVRRVETWSTCGRPGTTVCCRTLASGRTLAGLRRQGRCLAPPGGSACETAFPYVVGGCVPGGCAPFPACGNAVLEPGEACDPPNGTTCNAQCNACAPEAASTLLGCTSGGTEIATAATQGTFLAAWTKSDGFTGHAVARRLGPSGVPLDPAPVVASGTIPGTLVSEGFASAATADATSFYVAWSASDEGGFNLYFAGRRIPPSGAIVAPVELLVSHFASERAAPRSPARSASPRRSTRPAST